MQFEWDPKKERRNRARHGLGFETAALIFDDPEVLSFVAERYTDFERRWISIGRVELTILCVAHTVREDDDGEEIIRIISARKATPREEQLYFSR